MKTREHCVSFETVTPLWFGNSWTENAAPVKTSSLMGSLRFWLELICYFSGITTNKDYISDKEQKTIFKADLNAEEFHNKLIERLNEKSLTNTNDLVHEVLTSLSMPLPARVFGCTGWQGLIKVKEIKIKNDNRGEPNIPYKRIGIPKNDRNGRILINDECRKRSKQDYSVYFFPLKYSFYGCFDVVFETDEKTAQHILFPLLKFIDNYGFLGRAWNLGYGRVKVYFEDRERHYDCFSNYAEFNTNPVEFKDIVEYVNKIEDFLPKINVPYEKKLLIWNKTENNKEIKEIIKELIREKFFMRRSISNRMNRHQVFGTTSSPSHGSKILPWICKDGKKLKYGFVSVAGILNIRGEEKKKEG
jgi:CRISPR-associated protein Cmr1